MNRVGRRRGGTAASWDGNVGGVLGMVLRIIIVVGVLVGGIRLIGLFGQGGEPGSPETLWTRILGGGVLCILTVALLLVLSRWVERRPLAASGLADAARGPLLILLGALAWLLPAILAFGVLTLLGMPLTFIVPSSEFWSFLVLLIFAVLLMEAIPEELLFRGWVTRVLSERIHGWTLILVQAGLFTVTAVILRGSVEPLDLSLFATMGITFGYFRMVTGSIWTGIGFHTAFQTGSQLILNNAVLDLSGPIPAVILALGAVPFTLGVTAIAALAGARPRLFHPDSSGNACDA